MHNFKMFIFGGLMRTQSGEDLPCSDAVIMVDISNQEHQRLAPMKNKMHSFALQYTYPNDKAYIVGGSGKGMKTFKDTAFFDIKNMKLYDLPQLNFARQVPGVMLSPKQKLMTFAGM